MKAKHIALEAQYKDLKARLEEGGAAQGTNWKEKDKNDPARKQVAVLGWPEGLAAERRLNELEAWVKERLGNHRALTYSNEYKRPYSDRKLGKAAYINFASEDEARHLVKAVKESGLELKVQERKLKVVQAKTARSKQRDWALRKAEELLKTARPQAKVEVVWKERQVTVDTKAAFTQEKEDFRGSFSGSFAHLALPA